MLDDPREYWMETKPAGNAEESLIWSTQVREEPQETNVM